MKNNESQDQLENKEQQQHVYELDELKLDNLLAEVEIDSELRVATHRT